MKKSNKESIELSRHIQTFLNEYMPLHKTVSEHTMKSYKNSLRLYMMFLEDEDITFQNLCYRHLTTEYIEKWLVWLSEKRHLKPQSINNRLASLRVFLEYLGKKDIELIYLFNEASLVKRRKQPKIKIKGVSKKGMKALFRVIDTSTSTGLRDFVMIMILYNTAARIDEVLSLKIKHLNLNFEKPYISIVGKGNKIRSLYLLTKTVKFLKEYIQQFHGEDPNPDSYLFYSRIKGKEIKMSQPAVCKQLKKWAILAHEKCDEVPVTLHPHQIRHAAASHWLEDGMNIVQISYLLGHEQLQTTMVYLEVTTAQKASALNELIGENNKGKKKWKDNLIKLSDLCK